MKKKIFLVSLMAVALVCILAISAFAEDIIVSKTESEEYGTVIQLSADPGLDNASQYVSTLKKINNASTDTEALSILTDGTYFYVFPTSYINIERADGKLDLYTGTEENPGLAQAMAEFNDAMNTSYYEGYSLVGSGTERRIEETVRFTFPRDVTEMRDNLCCVRYYPKLVELRFTQAIDLLNGGDTFKGCNKLEIVVGFEKMDPTLLKRTIFTGCGSLQSIKLPTSITRIPSSMFAGCGKLRIENLDECTQLTTIGSGAFQDAKTLVFTLPDSVTTIEENAFRSAFKEAGASFTINETSRLQTIGESAFHDSKALAYIYIPSTVTSIGVNAFRNNDALETVENIENCKITTLEDGTFAYASKINTLKLPRTLKTIGTAFADNNALTLVYIPDSVESIANTFTGGKPTNAVFLYTGKNLSIFQSCEKLANANIIPASEYVESSTYTGINLVVGYSNCLAYNDGAHGSIIFDTIVSTYLEDIIVTSNCSICDMVLEESKIPALFVNQGFSRTEYEAGSILISFVVNKSAIAQYTEITGNSLSYGIFAVAQQNAQDENNVDKEIINADGTAIKGVASVGFSGYDYDIFAIRITGFETDAQKDAQLALGAYVIDNGKVSYLQAGTPDVGAKYSYVSYNGLA